MQDGKSVYAYLTEKRHYDIGTFKALEEVRDLIGQNRQLFPSDTKIQTIPFLREVAGFFARTLHGWRREA